MILVSRIKQCLRTPIKTSLFIVLLVLVNLFLCLGGSVWLAAQRGLQVAEEEHSTIAIPNMLALRELSGVKAAIYNPYNLQWMSDSQQTQMDAQEHIKDMYAQVSQSGLASEIAEPAAHRMMRAYAGEKISGVQPDMQQQVVATYYDSPGDLMVVLATCTDTNMLGFTLQSTQDKNGEDFFYVSPMYQMYLDEINITDTDAIAEKGYAHRAAFQVDEVLSPNQFVRPPEWIVTIDPNLISEDMGSADGIDNPCFEVGKQYLLVGRSIEEGTIASLVHLLKNGRFYRENSELQEIGLVNSRMTGLIMMPKEADISRRNVVHDFINISPEDNISYDMVTTEVSGTLDAFLADAANVYWKQTIEDICITLRSANVITTNNTNTLPIFHENRLSVIDGRDIEPDEYESGAPVCLVSNLFARRNGLKVGAEIPLQFYPGRFNTGRIYQEWNSAVPPVRAMPYDSSMVMTEPVTCQIVGIYSGEVEWDISDYAIGANTIILPDKAVPDIADVPNPYRDEMADYASPNLHTLVVPNGQAEAFYDEMGTKTLGRMYTILDQGYAMVAPGLNVIQNNASLLLGICLIAWAIIVGFFLLMFVVRSRTEAGIILSLGAGRRRAIWHIVSGVLIVAIISSIFSAALSYFLQEKAFDIALGTTTLESTRLDTFSEVPVARGSEEEKQDRLRASFTPTNVPILIGGTIGVQLIVIVLAAWICALFVLRKDSFLLMCGKEG